MRSNRTGFHRISPSEKHTPKIMKIAGVQVLLNTQTRVVTILDVDEGVNISQVMKHTYTRLARLGFTFVVATRQHLPRGWVKFLKRSQDPKFWLKEGNPEYDPEYGVAPVPENQGVKFNF